MTTQIELIKKEKGISPLEEVLKYRNENVPHRFRKHYNIDEEEADKIFIEMLKWLWLCAVTIELNQLGKIDFKVGVIRGLSVVDHMWHNFILHTEAYTDFCEKYFGQVVHHVPTAKKEDYYRIQSAEKYIEDAKTFYNNQHSLTYDLLGEETCNRWYVEYDTRYTKEKLELLRRPETYRFRLEEGII